MFLTRVYVKSLLRRHLVANYALVAIFYFRWKPWVVNTLKPWPHGAYAPRITCLAICALCASRMNAQSSTLLSSRRTVENGRRGQIEDSVQHIYHSTLKAGSRRGSDSAMPQEVDGYSGQDD